MYLQILIIIIHFKDLLDTMGLVQHVKLPTHIHGHTLDLIIYRIGYTIESQQTLGKKFIQIPSLDINTISRDKHSHWGQTLTLGKQYHWGQTLSLGSNTFSIGTNYH